MLLITVILLITGLMIPSGNSLSLKDTGFTKNELENILQDVLEKLMNSLDEKAVANDEICKPLFLATMHRLEIMYIPTVTFSLQPILTAFLEKI